MRDGGGHPLLKILLKEFLLGLHACEEEVLFGQVGFEFTDMIEGFLEEKDFGGGLVDNVGDHLAKVFETVFERVATLLFCGLVGCSTELDPGMEVGVVGQS